MGGGWSACEITLAKGREEGEEVESEATMWCLSISYFDDLLAVTSRMTARDNGHDVLTRQLKKAAQKAPPPMACCPYCCRTRANLIVALL